MLIWVSPQPRLHLFLWEQNWSSKVESREREEKEGFLWSFSHHTAATIQTTLSVAVQKDARLNVPMLTKERSEDVEDERSPFSGGACGLSVPRAFLYSLTFRLHETAHIRHSRRDGQHELLTVSKAAGTCLSVLFATAHPSNPLSPPLSHVPLVCSLGHAWSWRRLRLCTQQ